MSPQELTNLIIENPYYDQKEKQLWLNYVEKLNDSELNQVASHFNSLKDRADQIPSHDPKIQNSLLHILGSLHGRKELEQVTNALSDSDQEFSNEEWSTLLEEASSSTEKMVHFFATIGPDGLEGIAEIFFSSFMNKEIQMPFEEFTQTMASITGLKQMMEKANREYIEELQRIYFQELERNQVEAESSLDRADELMNKFLSEY